MLRSHRTAPSRPAKAMVSLAAAGGLTLALGAQALTTTEASAAKHQVILVTTKKNATTGAYLASAKGFTLYTFALDTTGKSACSGSCATEWPPLIVPKGAKLSSLVHGVKSSKLGKIKRSNGKFQLTYLGKPLYLFIGDKKAGQTAGQGFANVWSVATLSPAATTTPTTTAAAPPPTTPPPTAAATTSGSHASSGGSTPPATQPPATQPATTQPPTTTQPTTPAPAPQPPSQPAPPSGGYGY